MYHLFVVCDLRGALDAYARLSSAIQALGATSRVLVSVWYLRTTFTAVQVREGLCAVLEPDDRFIVIEATQALALGLDENQWALAAEHFGPSVPHNSTPH